ncbi:uncharacterized protein LOC143445671 isoform X3 [Clavelina lepadiformis]|uniref:uncharacterized protein LOC143445671 isoform X3 n=1 Tax=Clavelina lepadiformis TaxID=159417 RepID=UPI00404302E8
MEKSFSQNLRRLESQLKEVRSERDAFERDINIYARKNKALEQQVEALRSTHTDTDSKAVKLLQEVTAKHKQIIELREEEYAADIKAKDKELKSSQESLKALKHESKMLKENQTESKSTISKLNKQFLLLQEQLSKLQKENKDQDFILENTKSKLQQDSEKAISRQCVRIRVLEDQVNTLKADCDKKSRELLKVNGKLTGNNLQYESTASQHKEVVKSLQNQIKILEQNIKEKIVFLAKAKETVSSLESKNNSLTKKYDSDKQRLEDKLQSVRTELHEKDGQLCSVSNRLATFQKKDQSVYSNYTSKIERLEEDLAGIRKEENAKTQKLNKANIRIQLLESESCTSASRNQIKMELLESKLEKLKSQYEEKDNEVEVLTRKLTSYESNTASRNIKLEVNNRALEEQVKRLEKELNSKHEELCKVNTELSSHQIDVKSLSSQSKAKMRSLEEKIKKLEAENQKKEDQLCKVSSKLAHVELEGDSAASSYRVCVRTLEDRVTRLQSENKHREQQIIQLESEVVKVRSEAQTLKDGQRRSDLEKKRLEDELNQLRSVENELASQSSATSSQLQSYQREQKKMNAANSHLKSELTEATRKLSSLECDLAEVKCSIMQKDRQLEKVRESEKTLKEEYKVRSSQEQIYSQKIESLLMNNKQLKKDLQQANEAKANLVQSVEELSTKLNRQEKHRKVLQDGSTSINKKMQQLLEEHESEVSKLKLVVSNHQSKLKTLEMELATAKKFEKKCESLEEDHVILDSLKEQVEQYKGKSQQLQAINMELVEQQETLIKEHRNMSRKLETVDSNHFIQSKKMMDLEKTSEALKESCLMLEKQIEDLEQFNNQLIETQDQITMEKDDALRKCSKFEMELATSKRQLKAELTNLDQCSSDQITELKIELRNEMNQAHELAEEHRDLERRYKLLELNAAALQRKLNAEKDAHDRCSNDLTRVRADMEVLHQGMKRAEQNLHAEVDRCDVLEREKTQMLNHMDTGNLEHAHELIRLNCQGSQQTKLIDFLQSRIEELEPADKKKKKKKTTLYQAPLQYRELCDLLEEEKASNVRLQEQVNMLRSELQATNSKVKRMKHGIDTQGPLSPGSIAAISAIVKSPAANDDGSSSKFKQRSKPRMHHNIPHRLSGWLCNQSTRCSVCLAILHFGHKALKCSECSVMCHVKCRDNVTNTCGLPGGLFQQFKDGAKSSTLSPMSCVFKGSNSDQIHGRLKVLCGNDSWTPRYVRLCSTQLRISPPNAKSPSKMSDKDDIVDLKQAPYIHTDISQLELPNTAKQDLSYAFKIQTGSSNSCWPARSLYFLAAGFAEKHQWVVKLEAVVSLHNQSRTISANAKILGNEILTLLSDEKLEFNCSLPVSEKNILFGCDEGLFMLAPSTTAVSSYASMKKITGVSKVFQMSLLTTSQVIAIEGLKHKLVVFDIPQNNNVVPRHVENMEGCHLFTVGHAEGVNYLCVASASSISILSYNDKLKKFCKKKEIAASEPCTCMIFTACSVIIGTNNFYEIDLTHYKIDEFVTADGALSDRLHDCNVFPISVLKVKEHDGKQEFLLCFHEFGIFVDGFGHQTRSGQITWSRMPLSFAYREPYLIIVQFNSVEMIQLDFTSTPSATSSVLDHAFLGFPGVRHLGPAITEGAVYLSSNEGKRTSVFCCKGNMKQKPRERPMQQGASSLSNKRHFVALSSSMDSLSSPATKRSSAFSDLSNLSSSKTADTSSCYSIDSVSSKWTTTSTDDTTRWTSSRESLDSDQTLTMDVDRSISSSEDSTRSLENSTKLQWLPVQSSNKPPVSKPPRKGKTQGPIHSTEV